MDRGRLALIGVSIGPDNAPGPLRGIWDGQQALPISRPSERRGRGRPGSSSEQFQPKFALSITRPGASRPRNATMPGEEAACWRRCAAFYLKQNGRRPAERTPADFVR